MFLKDLELADGRIAEAKRAILLVPRIALVTHLHRRGVGALPVVELLASHPDDVEDDPVALAPPDGRDRAALDTAIGLVDLEIAETSLVGAPDNLVPRHSVHDALLRRSGQ